MSVPRLSVVRIGRIERLQRACGCGSAEPDDAQARLHRIGRLTT